MSLQQAREFRVDRGIVVRPERQPPGLRERDESGRGATFGCRRWGNEFRDDFTSVCHEDAFTRPDRPHVLSQAVF